MAEGVLIELGKKVEGKWVWWMNASATLQQQQSQLFYYVKEGEEMACCEVVLQQNAWLVFNFLEKCGWEIAVICCAFLKR